MVTQDERQKHIQPNKSEGVVFQTSAPPSSVIAETPTYQSDHVAYAVQNSYRPRQPRPLCTHCGQSGHVIQKCFKLHGYPPGYIPGFKSISSGYHSQRMPTPSPSSFQPRGQLQNNMRPHSVANIMTAPYMPTPVSTTPIPPAATNAINIDLSKINQDQLQSLLHQLTAHVQLSEPSAPSSSASSITEHGVMAAQSSSGVYSGLDAW
ncbi:unnamed protein product [Arabidopsis halleri]